MSATIKTYDNGLRLVVEPMPNFKSIAMSVLVMAGSGDETPNEQGLSHFCEHMLFKGTKRRTSQQLIDELAQLSVDYNAWTSEAATCFHAKGVADNIEPCFDIFADMYFNLKFEADDFDREGDVIVQEIAMHEDDPQSVLYDQLNATFFKGTKYEHPVAGFAPAIKRYQPKDIYHYIKKHYTAPNTIIAFSGDISVARAEALVAKYFLPYYPDTKATPKQRAEVPALCPGTFSGKKKKDTEQEHVALVFPACSEFSADRYPLGMLAYIFGGDMSSRLFINVREKLGLVYSIHALTELSDIGGYFAVVFSCTPKNTPLVIETVKREVENLRTAGISDAELAKVRNVQHVKRLFRSENTVAINGRNADELSTFGKIKTDAEYFQTIDAITVADINRTAQQYLDVAKMSAMIVGK